MQHNFASFLAATDVLRILPRATIEEAVEAMIRELDARDGDPDLDGHDELEPEEDEFGDQAFLELISQEDLAGHGVEGLIASSLWRVEDAEDSDSDCCDAGDDRGSQA